MRKLKTALTLLLTLGLVMQFSTAALADDATSGTCGENVTWTLDTDTGALTISGTGGMYIYEGDETPSWYAFTDSIKSVVIESGATSISRWAFNNCQNLTSISMPDSITSIGEGAFNYCVSLSNVEIPAGVTIIEYRTFYQCSGLLNVIIPESVTSIDERAFEGCSSLTSITIPDSVTSIGDSTFRKCSSLTSVTIPSSVTSIGSSAFRDCSSLTDVYYSGDETDWDAIEIGSSNECLTSATIHYTGSDGLIQLAAPSDLEWGVDYNYDGTFDAYVPGVISWTVNAPTQNVYHIDIYRVGNDDDFIVGATHYFSSTTEYTKLSVGTFLEDVEDVEESGTYYFTIYAVGDGTTYSDSEVVTSDTWTFEKPSDQLPVATGLTWAENDWDDSPISAVWDALADESYVYGFEVNVAVSDTADGADKEWAGSSVYYACDNEHELDANYEFANGGVGYYFYRVRYLSNDITTIFNSDWSDWSEPYYFDGVYSDISTTLDTIASEAETASEIKAAVQEIDTAELAASMAADNENTGVAAQIAELEALSGTTTTVTVSDAMADSFDSARISVIGGGLNTADGDAALTVDAAQDGDVIDTQLKNAVAFSMTLTGEDVDSTSLSVPVKITMPIPGTINPEFLVILHYHQGMAEPEELRWPGDLYIYEDDGQWYVSFVITSFSDFVMYEDSEDSAISGDLNGDGEVDASDLTILARHVGKVEYITDETALANADVTGDGNVDASDLTKLAQYVGKIISSLD